MDNKKISLAVAGAMLISLFLPFAKFGPVGISLFDALTTDGAQSAELIGITVLVVAFAVLTFMQKHLFARICSGVILLACLYGAYKMADAQSAMGQFGADVNMFSILGIGAYLLLLSSVAGVIFSKPSS
tara:strand:- start:333 stop:719 length:387 start_codon:yes stop_codon:yes gene_type:complete